jgi:hypothetical protein
VGLEDEYFVDDEGHESEEDDEEELPYTVPLLD